MYARMPGLAQRGRPRLGSGASRAVDYSRLVAPRRGEGENLPARVILGSECQVNVRTVEAVQERLRPRPIEEPSDDFGAGFGIGGGREGGEGYAQILAQCSDPEIVGPEIMAPLADAMSFVHRDQADAGPSEQRRSAF